MFVLVVISLLMLFLTYLESIGQLKWGMLIGFILLTIIMSLRYEYGNDYISYYQKFAEDCKMNFTIQDLSIGKIADPVWFLLNRCFKPLGFQFFVVFLTIANSIVYYRLIRFNLPKELWVFGLFIYLFTNSFFPMQLSMMRQSLAMALIISAVPFIIKKKILVPIILLIITSGIHSSAMICIPFLLVLYFNFINHKIAVLIGFVILFAIFFLAKDFIYSFISTTLNSVDALAKYDEKYLLDNKYDVSSAKSLFGMTLYLFPVIISMLYVWKSKNEKYIKYSMLYLFGSFVSLINQIVPMTGRLAWYFTIFSIVALPVAFCSVNKSLRYFFIGLFVLVTLKEYNDFFHAANWRQAFLEFKTIFS